LLASPHYFVLVVNKKHMSYTPVYGFNEGYALSGAPLGSFRTPSLEKVARSEQLYSPSIINLNPLTPSQSFETISVGARSYAMQPLSAHGQATVSMCANAASVSRSGASLCLNPSTGMCAPPPVPNACPRGHVAINQFSGAMATQPLGVTYGMMSYP